MPEEGRETDRVRIAFLGHAFTQYSALFVNYSCLLVVAAATEHDYDGKDYDPSAVIVKDVAKTVIHKVMFLRIFTMAVVPLIFIVCAVRICVQNHFASGCAERVTECASGRVRN